MLRAGDTLVVAGRDGTGGFVQTISAHNGTVQDRKRLDASPVWDGLAAAAGRLYVSLENGALVCLGED
jgi:hypothetical protein